MSEPVDAVTKVLREHASRTQESLPGYGDDPTAWQALEQLFDAAPTIAASIIEALGLVEERRTNVMSSCGQTTDYRTGITTHYSDMRYDHRFVTAWSPDE